MKQITEAQFESLKNEIYSVLIAGYDSEGNELSLGDMGNCMDATDEIINSWLTKESIELID